MFFNPPSRTNKCVHSKWIAAHSFCPKNHWTLQWRGLNLYNRGSGPQNCHFWGVRILRVHLKTIVLNIITFKINCCFCCFSFRMRMISVVSFRLLVSLFPASTRFSWVPRTMRGVKAATFKRRKSFLFVGGGPWAMWSTWWVSRTDGKHPNTP